MIENGIDPARYEAVGAKIERREENRFHFNIICADRELPDRELVKFGFESPTTPANLFNIFRRFDFILARKT